MTPDCASVSNTAPLFSTERTADASIPRIKSSEISATGCTKISDSSGPSGSVNVVTSPTGSTTSSDVLFSCTSVCVSDSCCASDTSAVRASFCASVVKETSSVFVPVVPAESPHPARRTVPRLTLTHAASSFL